MFKKNIGRHVKVVAKLHYCLWSAALSLHDGIRVLEHGRSMEHICMVEWAALSNLFPLLLSKGSRQVHTAVMRFIEIGMLWRNCTPPLHVLSSEDTVTKQSKQIVLTSPSWPISHLH